MRVNVSGCQRCQSTHHDLEFKPLTNPADEFKFWAMCPEIDEPVMLAVVETEDESDDV